MRAALPHLLRWANRPTQIAIVHQADGPHSHSLDFFVEYMGRARSLDKLSSDWAWPIERIGRRVNGSEHILIKCCDLSQNENSIGGVDPIHGWGEEEKKERKEL